MIDFTDPASGAPLTRDGDAFVAPGGPRYPIVAGVPRFCPPDNYTASFGMQWNRFATTQIDGLGVADPVSARRFFAETGWSAVELDGADVLEVGSGAGRFSRVILEQTRANLHSVDYSSAVEANWRTNGAIAPDRFRLAQASVYDLPFPDGAFDKVFCLGVLQHTPDFAASVRAIVAKARPRGEIVVDFYPIRGWWTKIHAKYLLRPFTKRMDHERLLGLIERNVGWLMKASDALHRARLGTLARFLPLVDQRTMPAGLTAEQRRAWSVLDTFDQYSPEHDHPQRVAAVAAMFEDAGARVTFAGDVTYEDGRAVVVRATSL